MDKLGAKETLVTDGQSESRGSPCIREDTNVKWTPNILDPDDALMKKFQQALAAHLSRVDQRLADEIFDLEASIKQEEKVLNEESIRLYQTQQEVERQHSMIDQYRDALLKLTSMREEKNISVTKAREIHRKCREKLEEEKYKKGKISRELEKLQTVQGRFAEWEKDLNDYIKISKCVSLHDANKRKDLMDKKQWRDYILSRLEEEVWRIETEIAYIDEHLQIKYREKGDAGRMIVDSNTDLDALRKEHRDLRDTWNSVISNISKRNSIYEQLQSERQELRKSYDELLLEIGKVQKETDKEMENNEHLTSLSFRLENNIKATSRAINKENDKIANMESQLFKLLHLGEKARNDYNIINVKYQHYLREEEQLSKQLEMVVQEKNSLEDAIFSKLEDKMIRDKAAKHINDLLLNSKQTTQEYEFQVVRMENSYGNSLLELERLSESIANRKTDLEELLQRSGEKEKELEELRKQLTKYDVGIERKQRNLVAVNKLLEQIMSRIGSEELGPQDLMIVGLERSIGKIRQNIQKLQQYWMRRQGFMVSLTQQRNNQLRDLNLLSKEILIMEQKNAKLEYALETLGKEEANVTKALSSLQQKLSQMNAELISRKECKEELEVQNCITKNVCMLSFQELEMDLLKLEANVNECRNEKINLKEALRAVQEESLSWEKKVQVTQETVKKLKEERSAGGIALMKSEIHKMEMRLSHLRRAQEKLINDMEFYVVRRDVMMDKMIGKLKRNPKEKHNRDLVIRRRLCDLRSKIKQLLKISKELEDVSRNLEEEIKIAENHLTESQERYKNIQDNIPDVQKEIERLEVTKYHNLQSLVFKQGKAKLLREIQSGRYKTICKNVTVIEEDLRNERNYRQQLQNIMEKTNQDFPMLRDGVRKILLTLRIL